MHVHVHFFCIHIHTLCAVLCWPWRLPPGAYKWQTRGRPGFLSTRRNLPLDWSVRHCSRRYGWISCTWKMINKYKLIHFQELLDGLEVTKLQVTPTGPGAMEAAETLLSRMAGQRRTACTRASPTRPAGQTTAVMPRRLMACRASPCVDTEICHNLLHQLQQHQQHGHQHQQRHHQHPQIQAGVST